MACLTSVWLIVGGGGAAVQLWNHRSRNRQSRFRCCNAGGGECHSGSDGTLAIHDGLWHFKVLIETCWSGTFCVFRVLMNFMRESPLNSSCRFALFIIWIIIKYNCKTCTLLIPRTCTSFPQILKNLEIETKMNIHFRNLDTRTMPCGKWVISASQQHFIFSSLYFRPKHVKFVSWVQILVLSWLSLKYLKCLRYGGSEHESGANQTCKVSICIWKTFISHMKPGYFCGFICWHMYNARHFDSYILSDAMYTGFLTVELSSVIINFPSEQSAHFIMEEVFTKSTIKPVLKHSTPKVHESTILIHLKKKHGVIVFLPLRK